MKQPCKVCSGTLEHTGVFYMFPTVGFPEYRCTKCGELHFGKGGEAHRAKGVMPGATGRIK